MWARRVSCLLLVRIVVVSEIIVEITVKAELLTKPLYAQLRPLVVLLCVDFVVTETDSGSRFLPIGFRSVVGGWHPLSRLLEHDVMVF